MIFIHGLKSDMKGKKSVFFNNFCRGKNISYLCFDLRGHGKSNGEFVNFGIGDWYNDLENLIKYLKINDAILIGSSMGGWIAMLYALHHPKKVSKLIGIASAPDFTKDLLWKELNTREKKYIKLNKTVKRKISNNFYYEYSPKLFKNSRNFLVKNIKKRFKGETILFHGSQDKIVPYNYTERFYKNENFSKLSIVTIKNADHSMSDKYSLNSIVRYI